MPAKLNRKVFAALTVALCCLMMLWLLSGQGYFTLNIFGSQYGFAHLKSFTFAVVHDELVEFPYTWVFLGIGVASCVFAAAIVWRHFRLRRTDD
ncbi:MAG: hypothetical protein NT154_14715 [Verrucomicrobia bacterium]|nr:hypothetical protein [Verrucomicrobiota bacterium]